MKFYGLILTFLLLALYPAYCKHPKVYDRAFQYFVKRRFQIAPIMLLSRMTDVNEDQIEWIEDHLDYVETLVDQLPQAVFDIKEESIGETLSIIKNHHKLKDVSQKAKRLIKKGVRDPYLYYIAANDSYDNNRVSDAIGFYKMCFRYRKNTPSRHRGMKKIRMRLGEECLHNIARIYFGKKDFKKAMKIYSKIRMDKASWPESIVDRAWIAYWKKNFNSALGALTAFKAPLLKSYYDPEASLIQAISYYQMCYYDDVKNVLDEYYKHGKILVKKYKQIKLRKNLAKDILQYRDPDIHEVFLPFTKTYSYSVMDWFYKQATKELKVIIKKYKSTKNKKAKIVYKGLYNSMKDLRKKVEFQIKSMAIEYINNKLRKILFINEELQKIYVQNLTKWRGAIYASEGSKIVKKKGNIDYVTIDDDIHFWDHRGAFWIDELGFYSYGLKNNCGKEE